MKLIAVQLDEDHNYMLPFGSEASEDVVKTLGLIWVEEEQVKLKQKHPKWLYDDGKFRPPTPNERRAQKRRVQAREKKKEKEINDLYTAIGRCTVKFEHTLHAVTELICQNYLPKVKSSGTYEVMFVEMTAGQIISLYHRLTLLHLAGDSLILDLSIELSKLLKNLNAERNKVIHSIWFVGDYCFGKKDFSEVKGVFPKINRNTYTAQETHVTKEYFDELSLQADILKASIMLVQLSSHSDIQSHRPKLLKRIAEMILYSGAFDSNIQIKQNLVAKLQPYIDLYDGQSDWQRQIDFASSNFEGKILLL